MSRELLTLSVSTSMEWLFGKVDVVETCTLLEIAHAIAVARCELRRMTGQIEQQFKCGGAFSLETQKEFMRLIKETPLVARTVIQEH